MGLPLGLPVYVGIHDRNALLLPHLLGMGAPFGVVSTDTWVIVMAIGGRKVQLDAARDTLININALGQPVPSARFMGGREYALLTQGAPQQDPSKAEIADILAQHTMLLPSIVPDAGPFQRRASSWHGVTPQDNSGHYCAAVSLYLAMMTLTCLELIGQRGPILVERPFATNRAYLQMLRVISGQRVPALTARTGTSIGAALLTLKGNARAREMVEIATPNWPNARAYWSQWRRCIASS